MKKTYREVYRKKYWNINKEINKEIIIYKRKRSTEDIKNIKEDRTSAKVLRRKYMIGRKTEYI